MAREALEEYLEAVGAEIRWRRARRPLLRELSDHIADQAADFQAQGLEEEAALDRAVAEMGDPETVGRDLDRLHRPQNRWGLALGVLFLLLAGLLLQYLSARFLQDSEADYYFRRQGFGALLSAGVLAGLWSSDCTLLLRRRWAAGAALGLTAAVCLAAWMALSWLRAQSPVTYLTLLTPVPYAALLYRLRGRGGGTVLLSGLGALALAALLLLRRVRRLRSRSGKLLALSALLPLLLQGVLYLLFNLGYSPLGPLSLPFLSFGAAYLLTNSLLAGFLLSVFRMDALLRDGPDQALPSPFPNRLDLRLPLGRGSLSIRYRRSS